MVLEGRDGEVAVTDLEERTVIAHVNLTVFLDLCHSTRLKVESRRCRGVHKNSVRGMLI